MSAWMRKFLLVLSVLTSQINGGEDWDLSQEAILKNLKELGSLGWDLSDDGLQYWFLGAKLGYYDVLTFLMPYVDINVKNAEERSALQIAAKNGRVKIAKLLLENGATVDERIGYSIITPLALAASRGHSVFVPLILAHGGDIYCNRASMHLAARFGHSATLNALLEAGFDVEAKAGNTPLYEAAIHGHINAVKVLLDKGADLEVEYDGCTPLGAAAIHGHSTIVDILLESGAKMNYIHKAAFRGDIHSLNLVISLGSASLMFSKNNMNALHFASCSGQSEVVKLLVEKGLPINGVYSNTVAPLHLAARNGHIEIVQILLNAGANPKAFYSLQNFERLTPLFLAAGKGHATIIDLLLTAGAVIDEGTCIVFPEETDRDQFCRITPLQHAIHYGHLDTVIRLIQAGAKNLALDNGWSPLHEGAECGYSDIVQFLLEEGAEVDSAEKKQFRTPLHLAAKNGHLTTVKKLVLFGANLSARDKKGKTPARLAAENGYFDIVEYLMSL